MWRWAKRRLKGWLCQRELDSLAFVRGQLWELELQVKSKGKLRGPFAEGVAIGTELPPLRPIPDAELREFVASRAAEIRKYI